jgi:ferredoxin-NADP reductase
VGTVLARLALAAAADLTGRAHDAISLRVERIELAADNIRLLAGGIGVTPIIAMARELQDRGAQPRMV